MSAYRKPEAGPSGLRLHLNENTRGCSPRVLQRLRELDATVASLYPDYGDVLDATAGWFDVEPAQIILTNGMDEGIFCTTVIALRGQSGAEAIVVEPAFEVYAACAAAMAGRVVRVRLDAAFDLSADAVLDAVTPHTRLIYLNDPHNPSGARIRRETIAEVARRAPDALVFLDEAYAEFAPDSFIRRALDGFGNVLVGRTFAKAYGLAGLRLGAVIAPPPLVAQLKEVVPPYSINAYGAAALPAALEDRAYIDDYIAQAARSRELIREWCERLGVHAFPSAANFVLIRVGPRAAAVAVELGRRGIFVRDRSDQPLCDGCLRLTAGIVDDTRRALAALEEVLCAAP